MRELPIMVAILVAIRDFLIAAALAWVGISIEQRPAGPDGCSGEACQTNAAER
ncbi:MAG: hypothetical protein K2P58_08510 [Hyphomonadaceae bacterium]|nr:hypothetical protein [Hyphomonadaceae bacterium]